jgi:hypothetical protein
MDPAMSAAFPFWSWHTSGVYFGMPLINWAGWLFTGVVIAVPLLVLARYRPLPDEEPLTLRRAPAAEPGMAERLRAQQLPLWLYALNGLFPFALALTEGMVGAAVIGGVVMALFLASPLLVRPRAATLPAAVRQA